MGSVWVRQRIGPAREPRQEGRREPQEHRPFTKESTMKTITSTSLRTLLAGAILSALAFSFATVSSANEGTTPPQVIVKFADLDLSTSQGAVALYGRIHSAAVNVCSRVYDSDLAYKLNKDACLQEVIAD